MENNDKMIKELDDFLETSPYTDEEKADLTLSVFGLKQKLEKIEVRK